MKRDGREEELRHRSVADSDGGVADGAHVPLQGPDNSGGSGVLESKGAPPTSRHTAAQSRPVDAARQPSAAHEAAERRDPVCGNVVPASTGLQSEYANLTYYFDSPECLRRFDQEPDLFTNPAGEGNIADNDRAQRGDAQNHKGKIGPRSNPKLEQPRIESGSG